MKALLHTFVTLGFLLYSTHCLPTAAQSDSVSKIYPRNGWNSHHRHGVLTIEQLQAKQPLDGLPSNSNVTLVHSTLGIGVQNYTCNGTAFVQTDPGDGAAATLYETTQFLERYPEEINRLSQDCNFQGCKYPEILRYVIGHHFFTAALVPTFDLSNARPPLFLSASKSGDVPSPDGPSNIDWLFLTANAAAGPSRGLSEVYRIDTFQGKAPAACSAEGQTTSVSYTAQYWFYD